MSKKTRFYCNARVGNTCITVCFNQCVPCMDSVTLDILLSIPRTSLTKEEKEKLIKIEKRTLLV